MDRAEKIGLGVAMAGHVLLFAFLSARFFSVPVTTPIPPQPMEVSLVKDVALAAAAPHAVEPPAPSVAPDRGVLEDTAPPEPVKKTPEPEPKPTRARAVEKPAPAPKPTEAKKPAPTKKPRPEPAATPEKTAAKAAPTHAKPVTEKGNGVDIAAKSKRPRGSLLGDDFLKGLSDRPSKSSSLAPVAAKVDAHALASIQAAIARQIQPCADRQVDPGPGANAIVTTFNLHLNQDGSLAATPRMVRQTGTDDENSRYAQRVIDLGVAAFKGCTPLKLPAEYYSTAAGGWNNINYNWRLK